MSLLQCKGLASILKGKATHLFAKCTLLGESGHRNNKVAFTYETKLYPLDSAVSLNQEELIFHISDELHSMEYMRVEIIASGSLTTLSRYSLGAAFIPLSSFTEEQQQCQFCLQNFRRTKDLIISKSMDFGSIEVCMQRMIAQPLVASAELALIANKHTPLSQTHFLSDAVLAGAVHLSDAHAEQCLVSVQQEHLLITLLSNTSEGPNWRRQHLEEFPNAVLATCRERTHGAELTIKVSYQKVNFAVAVSSSIALLSCTVRRLFVHDQEESFQEAEMFCFVMNCPATGLVNVVSDRIAYCDVRKDLTELLQSDLVRSKDTVGDDHPLLIKAATLYTELDEESFNVEKLLEDQMAKRELLCTREAQRMLRVACRLRLYMTALLTANITGQHNFKQDEVRAIMEADFKRAQKITQDSDVATANNRIEYLL
ncbi:hypothetical protein EON65_28120, partial [archaeon]